MRAKVWLMIACIFILVHLLGHAVGHASWKKPDDAGMQEVVDAMVSYKSEFMSATRSMVDYYIGYSLILFFVYAMSISILWVVSRAQRDERGLVKKILYPMAFAWLAFGVVEFMYFFPFAATMSLGAGLLMLAAIFRMETDG